MTPNTIEEWKEYIFSLSEEELRDQMIGANTHAFVNTLTDEGDTVLKAEEVLGIFAKRMKMLDVDFPSGGLYPLQALLK